MINTDTEGYRKELQAHCYRMLGSTPEAEDAVQETMLRAWRSWDRFEARSSLRNWLYRIATNVCLSALSHRTTTRWSMPQLSGPAATRLPEKEALTEQLWLEPYPDALLEAVPDTAPGPQARYEMREATQLAFVAAIQYLPARQRAVLLLRDVLGWSAAETAGTHDASVAAVNSALQRARETVAKKGAAIPTPISNDQQRLLLDRYVQAWESADLEELITLLKEDAIFSMPPFAQWYQGRDAIRGLLAWAWREIDYQGVCLVPTHSNGQPAFGVYGRDALDAPWHAHAIHVLTLDDVGVAVITNFLIPGLFPIFGLPQVLEEV